MQKRVLLNLVAIAFSVCLLVACSSDSSADSNVIEVPAKGNVALESSFDFKVLKSCDDVKGLSLAKSEDKSGMENEDDFDYDDFERFLNDRFTNENVDFYVNEDGSATVTKNLFVDCGGVNTIDYEIVNDGTLEDLEKKAIELGQVIEKETRFERHVVKRPVVKEN